MNDSMLYVHIIKENINNFIIHPSLISQAANAYILRLPCLSYANFSIAKGNHTLLGDVLMTLHDVIEEDCENECKQHRLCKSINTRNATGENCQLISKSTEDPFDNAVLSSRVGWTYKTTDHKARNVIAYNVYFFQPHCYISQIKLMMEVE